ncbi:MAG TPA: putative colanic acid biosynthesis acetyltransferase [Opitutaceae bacterium]|nr:putative colanic acid biosynthesis acetyltransferase [Opitutaceae bacterium]
MSSEPPFLGQHCQTPYPPREIVLRGIWAVVQATAFRWSPRPLHRWRAWLLVLFGARIPETGRVVVFPTARVVFPWKLTLQPRSMVGPHVTIYNLAPITFQYGANVSQNCHLCSGTHDYRLWSMPLVTHPITIGQNAWVSADVFVGPGVTIGELAVIGARSVVVHDIPPRMVCAGNPCRPLKDRPDPI